MLDLSFYKNKTVFITGHTGFKGTWLTRILNFLGARVVGYSLPKPTDPCLFEMLEWGEMLKSNIGDIRNYEKIKQCMAHFQPEIVLHLAAQPLVRESYHDPRYTYDTNVMGTVNILEACRELNCVRSFLNVTTDKVYKNNEWEWGYRENDLLDGFDPYSNSKSCSDIVTQCYRRSFSGSFKTAISTARAGNVIGGGDFAKDRIIPDCIRAVSSGRPIVVRNPHSIRPYQHVIEPLIAYLIIAQRQYEDVSLSGEYNIGPDESNCVTTGCLVDLFCKCWGDDAKWEIKSECNPVHEASFLRLDCSKAKQKLDWRPVWSVNKAVEFTVDFAKSQIDSRDLAKIMDQQIINYLEDYDVQRN